MQGNKHIKQFSSVLELVHQFPDEKSCKIYLAALRWPTKKDLHCPHCGSTEKVYVFQDKITYSCGDCKRNFNAKTGTVFSDSKVPLQKWFLAIYLISSHKKGISSLQLAKDINVTQRTAWYMNHRLRIAAENKDYFLFKDVVEVDETYVGGLYINKHREDRLEGGQGRNTRNKTAVIGIFHRPTGVVRAFKVDAVDEITLQKVVEKHVDSSAILVTDEWKSYGPIGKGYSEHLIVKHGQGQYVNDIAHTNNMENFWSHFKRGIIGIYHYVSRKHLNRYVNEYVFRYNTRKMNEAQRFDALLKQSIGKLTYKELIGAA